MKVKEYIQWLLPSRKWRVLAIIITGVIVGGGALTLYMLRAHTYLTDDPAACVNCHIMGPYYATWFHSSHSRNATCNDCHVPYENPVKKWVFKGMDGMRHVAVFLTRGEKDVLRANKESAEVIMNNCIQKRDVLEQRPEMVVLWGGWLFRKYWLSTATRLTFRCLIFRQRKKHRNTSVWIWRKSVRRKTK